MNGDVGELALEVMGGLIDHLATRLADSRGGPPCFAGMVPGSLAVADRCGCTTTTRAAAAGAGTCGMAWVRLDRVFDFATFPQADTSGKMCTGTAAVIEVGTFRCQPVSAGNGEPPSAAALAQAVLVQTDDMAAIRHTIQCAPVLKDRQTLRGTWLPRDGGGCGGGIYPVTVELRRT